jgi:hypothetical protein
VRPCCGRVKNEALANERPRRQIELSKSIQGPGSLCRRPLIFKEKTLLIKFSQRIADRASQRWSDLLVAEHLASKALGDIGVTAAAKLVP